MQLNVSIALSADNQFLLDLDLAHDIDPQASKYEVMSTKVGMRTFVIQHSRHIHL